MGGGADIMGGWRRHNGRWIRYNGRLTQIQWEVDQIQWEVDADTMGGGCMCVTVCIHKHLNYVNAWMFTYMLCSRIPKQLWISRTHPDPGVPGWPQHFLSPRQHIPGRTDVKNCGLPPFRRQLLQLNSNTCKRCVLLLPIWSKRKPTGRVLSFYVRVATVR